MHFPCLVLQITLRATVPITFASVCTFHPLDYLTCRVWLVEVFIWKFLSIQCTLADISSTHLMVWQGTPSNVTLQWHMVMFPCHVVGVILIDSVTWYTRQGHFIKIYDDDHDDKKGGPNKCTQPKLFQTEAYWKSKSTKLSSTLCLWQLSQ